MRLIRVLSALMVGALVLGAPAAVVQGAATTFTVTKTADTNDGTCDADCSLREAITAANANAGTDTIAFNIPGAGPHTIQPTSPLFTITDPVIIDGYTQPGASANTNGPGLGLNTVLKIELDGTNAGASVRGLHITAGNSTIKGLVINRFSAKGINVEIGGGNVIEGNFIGTDVTGNTDLGNGDDGVEILGTPDNIIGGTSAEARNLISGNDGSGVVILFAGATGNLVRGNLIGTDIAGTAALGNSHTGLFISRASNNTIGGTTAAARNIISGNGFAGIQIGEFDPSNGTTDILVQGNFIGTDVTGTAALGNSTFGVNLVNAPSNTVGGTATGAGNTIAFNGSDGIFVELASATGNALLGNSIFSNTGLGIDLGTNGVTPNDAGDGDAGANDLQNFPVLTSAVTGGGTGVTVVGTLDSAANAAFRVEFFANTACDPSGNGEGETFLGAATASTDGSGSAVFVVGLTKAVLPGAVITATATDPANNTSEFSACQTATAAVPVPGISGPWLAGLAALLAAAFAWTAVRRARVTAPAR